MVIDHSYKISAFGDFTSIQPTPDNMLFFIQTFGNTGLVPSLFQEVQLTPGGVAIPQQRVALVSSDNLIKISILTNRLDYEVTASSDKKLSVDDRNIINQSISDSFGLIFSHFNKNALRLAINAESYVSDLTDAQIVSFLQQYSNPLSLYNNTTLNEWNTRLMVRKVGAINDLPEMFNIITTINKAKLYKRVDGTQHESEGFSVLVDINTVAENGSYRFSAAHIIPFIETVSVW